MIPVAQPIVGVDEQAAVKNVLESGHLAQGAEVEAFEEEFSAIVDGRRCIAVNSGTSALHLGMLAAGIGRGDEVIVPSFTFAATANAVSLTGAKPVFVDIEADTFCIDPTAVEAAVTEKTTAILPVHLYGHPASMDSICAIADRHGLMIVEDAAQAHAASWDGNPVGALGQIAAFSFYPTKNMTAGEGGMIVTDDLGVERMARLLRNQGMERRYENEVVGFNARMTDVHAAIGRVQLGKLSKWTLQRQTNATWFDANLTGVQTPPVRPKATHVYHQYTIRSVERELLIKRLTAAQIGFGVYYPTPTHTLPSFGQTNDLPETTRAAKEVLSLPVHPSLDSLNLEQIANAVNG